MTTNQTIDGVPRELLKQALRIAEAVHFPTDNYETKLRALLDGPVRTPLLGGGALEEQPEWAQIQILKNTVADLQGDIEKLQAELALQPQDEPVAWRFRWDYDHGNGWCRNAVRFVESMEHVEHEDKSTWRDVTPLYAEQPVPVAVAMPERLAMTGRGLMDAPTVNHHLGWNSCLDELKRLNPSL